MQSLKRVKTALEHEEPDRVPVDLGGAVTGITQKAHENLREYYGIETPDCIIDKKQQLAKPGPEILDKFDIDTRYIYLDQWEFAPKSQEDFYIDPSGDAHRGTYLWTIDDGVFKRIDW